VAGSPGLNPQHADESCIIGHPDDFERKVPVLASAPGTRLRSVGLVVLGIVASGLLLNVYLAIVARSLTAAEYAYFGAFWSLAQVAGFGMFLSIEQETARLLQTPGRPRGVLRAVLLTAATMAVAMLAVVALGWPVLSKAFGGQSVTVVAMAVLCLVSAGQFVVRGALIGMDRMGRHAAIMLFDSALRVGLAALVASLVTTPGSPAFAWTLVVAIGLAHAPQLLSLLRRRTRATTEPDPDAGWLGPRTIWTAVAPLLMGSLCAQLLLNGPPVLVPVLAQNQVDVTRAGQFLAVFTLTRIPLFLVVPLQTALLPMFTSILHSGDRAALHRLVRRLSLGLLALAAAAFGLGFLLGPWLVRLIFGAAYVLPGSHIALLAVGVATYIGLVLVTQVLVASVRHRLVAWSWLSGLLVAGVVLALVQDLLLRAELAFLLGSLVGWLVATALVLSGRRERELQSVA
jgi:O-antigen/teichoic acid export membrane protein